MQIWTEYENVSTSMYNDFSIKFHTVLNILRKRSKPFISDKLNVRLKCKNTRIASGLNRVILVANSSRRFACEIMQKWNYFTCPRIRPALHPLSSKFWPCNKSLRDAVLVSTCQTILPLLSGVFSPTAVPAVVYSCF